MFRHKNLLAAILIIAMAVASLSAASIFPEGMKWDPYGGLTTHQYSLKGFKDVRISDYETYGSREGSLLLSLASQNGSGLGFGATVGLRSTLTEKWDVFSDFTATFAGKGGGFYNLNFGAVYGFKDFDVKGYTLHLGAGGRAGFFMYSKNLGRAEILKGTTPPVAFPDGRIHDGDPISYKVYGINIEPLMELSMKVTEKITVAAQIGLQLSIPFSNALSSDKVDIDPKTNPGAYYAPVAEQLRRIDFNPKASINGFSMTIYCRYAFDMIDSVSDVVVSNPPAYVITEQPIAEPEPAEAPTESAPETPAESLPETATETTTEATAEIIAEPPVETTPVVEE